MNSCHVLKPGPAAALRQSESILTDTSSFKVVGQTLALATSQTICLRNKQVQHPTDLQVEFQGCRQLMDISWYTDGKKLYWLEIDFLHTIFCLVPRVVHYRRDRMPCQRLNWCQQGQSLQNRNKFYKIQRRLVTPFYSTFSALYFPVSSQLLTASSPSRMAWTNNEIWVSLLTVLWISTVLAFCDGATWVTVTHQL